MANLNADVDKILYKMGYFHADPLKKQEVQGYIDEAVEFMRSCGVKPEKLTTHTAHAIKSIWADARDKGDNDNIIKKDGMIVALLSQLKRG